MSLEDFLQTQVSLLKTARSSMVKWISPLASNEKFQVRLLVELLEQSLGVRCQSSGNPHLIPGT